jgi:hypothetical protein
MCWHLYMSGDKVEVALKFIRICWIPLSAMRIWGKNMSKRAKRGKTETLTLPVVGRVAIGALATAAVGYSLLSRPASVQPIKGQSARQVLASSTPGYVSTPVHVLASAPALVPAPTPQVETPKAADVISLGPIPDSIRTSSRKTCSASG